MTQHLLQVACKYIYGVMINVLIAILLSFIYYHLFISLLIYFNDMQVFLCEGKEIFKFALGFDLKLRKCHMCLMQFIDNKVIKSGNFYIKNFYLNCNKCYQSENTLLVCV